MPFTASSLTYESENVSISSATANSILFSRYNFSKPQKGKRKNRKRRKTSPRLKLIISFITSEIVIVALCFLNIETFLLVMKRSFAQKASRQLHLMDWTYSLKIDRLALDFYFKSSSRNILEYLEYRNQSLYNVIADEIKYEAEITEIEYATLLDSDRHILFNINQNRTGHLWDPSGFIDLLIQKSSMEQIAFTGVIPFSEISNENIPLLRERVSEDQPLPLTHPYDTYGPALLRYVITPFFSENSSVLLGIFVAGDLVNGKTPITYLTVDAFQQGFSGVFMKSTQNGKTIVSSCTGSLLASIDGFDGKILTSSRDPTPISFVEKVFESPSDSTYTERAGAWSFAAKKVRNIMSNGNELDSAAVMVRAISDDDSAVYNLIFLELVEVLIFILCTDLLFFLLSFKMFIRPLELLAKKLKRKSMHNLVENGEELQSTFDQLKSRKKIIYFIFIPFHLLKSTMLPALIILTLKYGLKHSQGEETESALGVANIMFDLKVAQMSVGFHGLSHDADFRQLLDFPNNSILTDSIYDMLQNEINHRKIEFSFLIDSNRKVIYDPNRGTSHAVFDPEGLVSMTMNSGLCYKKSVIVPNDDYLEMSPPTHVEQFNNSLTDSKLHPDMTESSILVRFTTAPVFAASKHLDKGKPDGVLIAGDVINGKTIICERVIDVMEEGFCGIYIYEEARDEFDLISSVFHLPGTEDLVDYDLPEREFLYEALTSGDTKTTSGKMFFQNIFFQPYIIVVHTIPPDQFISSSGQFEMDREKEFAFIVYAHRENMDSAIWLWIGVSFQVFGILLSGFLNCWIIFMAFKPVKNVLSKIGKMGFLRNIQENKDTQSYSSKNRLATLSKTLQKFLELPQKMCSSCSRKEFGETYSPVGNKSNHQIQIASQNSPPPSKWAKKSSRVLADKPSNHKSPNSQLKTTGKTTPLSARSNPFFAAPKHAEDSWHLA